MRRVRRVPLDPTAQADLDNRQTAVNRMRTDAAFSAANEWKNARQSATLSAVMATLAKMMGKRQRCMYCLDSHGTDIDHFWPKTPYPERMFVWLNLLLCCVECGRFKGDRFPTLNGEPRLIDPTSENPWDHLDFDPTTGNVVPKFEATCNGYAPKGVATVGLLQLDQREAMACGYKKTLRRLSRIVEDILGQKTPSSKVLVETLSDADDHGLLTWCFLGSGRNDPPFRDLRELHPDVWSACEAAFA